MKELLAAIALSTFIAGVTLYATAPFKKPATAAPTMAKAQDRLPPEVFHPRYVTVEVIKPAPATTQPPAPQVAETKAKRKKTRKRYRRR